MDYMIAGVASAVLFAYLLYALVPSKASSNTMSRFWSFNSYSGFRDGFL
jgi:hypothetical protein